jgi:signal transduction histidine kinase
MNLSGCGLGLAISKNIAKALGGDIKVKSSVKGKGSVFVFRIKEMDKSSIKRSLMHS